MQAAREFAPRLARCIQWASLKFGHSMSPSLSEAVESQQKIYAGSLPTVFATALKAHDYHTSMTSKASRHISELVTCINDAFEQNVTSTVATGHPLSLALELHSNVGFSGGANAQFIALFSALEVLVPQKSKANRGDIVRLVKNTLSGIGRTDAKTVGKRVEALYIERNALVHEGKAISSSMVNELDQIVRDTLIALVSIAPATQATA